MTRLVITALIAACPFVTAAAQTLSPYAPLTIPLKIEQVPGNSIWYSTGNPGIPGKDNEGNTSNAGFVVTSDGVVVFDALGTPSLGWALLEQIRKITDKNIRYVVASHYHADHIYGLQAFRDHTSAIIVAQERSGEYKDNEHTADERANQRLDQRRTALFPWVDGNTRVVPPDITFKERMTITIGERRLTLLYAGPAHSSSDMMMMVEPDGVLFAGDIVQNGQPSDRVYSGLYSVCSQHDGHGSSKLDGFRCRLRTGRLVEVPGDACVRQQQSWQCLPNLSGTGTIAVQS